MQGVGDDQIELIQFEPSWRPIKPIGKQYRHHLISSHQSIEPWQKSRTRKKREIRWGNKNVESSRDWIESGQLLEGLDRDGARIRSPRWKRVWHHRDASDANYPLNLWILIGNHPATASKIPPSSNKKRIKRRKKLQHQCSEKASGSGCDGHANPRTKPQPEN